MFNFNFYEGMKNKKIWCGMFQNKVILLVIISMIFNNGKCNKNIVTNEDIRDAILQVVNVVRSTEDKLERHEYRERVLGEQLKKGMISIDKRIKMLDPSRNQGGQINRLDQRLAAVETILIQKDDRERIQLQKTFETVEDVQKNLPTIVEKLKRDILDKLSESATNSQIINSVNNLKSELMEKVNDLYEKVNSLKTVNNKKATDDLDEQISSTKELLGKYENKLAMYNNINANIPTKNIWQTDLLKVLDKQKSDIEEINVNIKLLSNRITEIIENGKSIENTTIEVFEKVKYETTAKLSEILDLKIQNFSKNDLKIEEISKKIDVVTVKVNEHFKNLNFDIKELGKIEQVMVQTADNILDTKRRMEYGIHQILAEIAQSTKGLYKDIDAAINERFDNFETMFLDNETGALTNFSLKIGQDLNQIWRQIGIMHQQMTTTENVLNKLENQTDTYVNGSLSTMDNMKGKVGKISSRIIEVDENLNFLLGKLSLVTQEFNQIKTGLGQTLDEIRKSFKTVEDKVKNNGPGPHQINNEVAGTN